MIVFIMSYIFLTNKLLQNVNINMHYYHYSILNTPKHCLAKLKYKMIELVAIFQIYAICTKSTISD